MCFLFESCNVRSTVETFTLVGKKKVQSVTQETTITKQGEKKWGINSDNVFCTPLGTNNWTQTDTAGKYISIYVTVFPMLSMLVGKMMQAR